MTRRLAQCLRLNDFEHHARQILPRSIYGYIHAAAEDRHAFDANIQSFRDYALVTNVLVDTTQRSNATTLFGTKYAQPFGMAPVGLSALYTYRGDCVLAEVAARRNVPMIMSSSSLIPLEEVARINPHAWFQAYLPGDSDKTAALVQRVIDAGFKTLVLTVDTPAYPNKDNYIRAGFSSPLTLSGDLIWQGVTHPTWTLGTFMRTVLRHGIPHFENNYATRGMAIIARNVERTFTDRASLNWTHFEQVREMWPHTLVIKGVLNPRDAVRACASGVDGIIISNHGGRQLDDAVAPLHVLPEILKQCPDVPVMLDGGIRRGVDVLKALALGAAFVFVGRPFAFAAATAAGKGIEKAVDLLSAEIDRNLAMLGINRIEDLTRDCLLAKRA